ncbi:hypothetical protein [Paracoccus sp. ME4]|uniref:hypothetical protein n=1 Tax=Paracoccus sp. ME4 TaxID=3138066 RepID=UPI00398A97D5
MPAEPVTLPLSAEEIGQLRQLMAVARYDAAQRAVVIQAGRARVLVREDGTVRLEGVEVTVAADGAIVLDGAAIELN